MAQKDVDQSEKKAHDLADVPFLNDFITKHSAEILGWIELAVESRNNVC
ncbi:hypothetical protein ACFX5U_07240 [Sphingobacterium sp. SG20118]|nr:hypothetical protein [Sphingobacterium faecium]MDH5827094.1 hypothetical protein [Sphingobacterium faecium]